MNRLNVLAIVLLMITNTTYANSYTANEKAAISIVDQQLVAYNNQDIDAFVATYHQDVEIYNFPNKLQYKGRDKLRAGYQGMFANLKCLKATSKTRIVQNNTVIDDEIAEMCTQKKGQVDKTIKAIAIYEVEDGLIKRVMFQQ
jgi:hypothetical protein